MSLRSSSPPLPTFGIRDLSGPAPGLISITQRQYESTIKSQPDAKLLYLDDDDGELITVGSGFELSQRLEEPVQRYTRGSLAETRNPLDNALVHVFDIKHSAGSLAEWRDHEAYSSKNIRRTSISEVSASASTSSLELSPIAVRANDFVVPAPKAIVQTESIKLEPHESESSSSELGDVEGAHVESVDVLGGVEKHLNGLANVLQIAADTMQKAANKTRETDATVIEDILKGVKDILFEVGSFGVDVYKEMNRSLDMDLFPASEPDDSAASDETEVPIKDEQEELTSIKDEQAAAPTSPSASAAANTDSRVKFASVEDEDEEPASIPSGFRYSKPLYRDESDDDDVSEYDDANPSIADSQIFKPSETQVSQRDVKQSILDDSSEDADFTARYPPLHTVRRARSTLEFPNSRNHERLMKAISEQQPVKLTDNPTFRREGNPWIKSLVGGPKTTGNEACQKPLPGAWPDAKTDAGPILPRSSESSGAFFNRMTGRTARKDMMPPPPSGLQRANTTASSNPASRLNGPFDPGFPYEPSKASHPNSRLHRQSNSQFRDLSDQLAARSYQSPATKALTRLDSEPSVPDFACSARREPINLMDYRPRDHLRRLRAQSQVKRYRSVPQFQPYKSPTAPLPASCIPNRSASTRSSWVSQLSMPSPDYLTGNPSVPLNTYPVVSPQPYVPARVPPAPPAPQLKPFVPSPVSGQSVTSTTFSSPLATFAEPVPSYTFPPGRVPAQIPLVLRQDTDLPRSPSSPSAVSTDSSPEAERAKNKFDSCVEMLQMCGFGIDDDNLKNRLHVYAVAANGNVEEAVEMIEEDRRVSGRFE